MHLWAKEKARVQFALARLYEQFASEQDFVDAETYAKDNKVLLWSKRGHEGWDCALAVREDAHETMKRWFRSKSAPAHPPASSGAMTIA